MSFWKKNRERAKRGDGRTGEGGEGGEGGRREKEEGDKGLGKEGQEGREVYTYEISLSEIKKLYFFVILGSKEHFT